MKHKYYMVLLVLMAFFSRAQTQDNEKLITEVLNDFHQAAANAQTNRYFGLMTEDAIFLGTDATERWTKADFKHYVKPHFAKGNGWVYKPKQRNINVMTNSQVAFFDELLINAKYGLCRGTGILVKTEKGWKISQYSLSIPVPNGMANDVVEQIKIFQDKE